MAARRSAASRPVFISAVSAFIDEGRFSLTTATVSAVSYSTVSVMVDPSARRRSNAIITILRPNTG